jgi:hypothetical protein
MRSLEDDEEAQKRGVVGCMYCMGGGIDFDLQLVRNTGRLRNALPVRSDSVHVCYNDPRAVPVFTLAIFIIGAHTRMRFRAHYGSDEECQCQLSSFGIPISALPVSPQGEFNLENHRAFVATQRAIEAIMSKGKGPLCVPQKTAQNQEEKVRSIRGDVFVAAPQPDLTEPTGYARLMNFSNFGFSSPWRRSVVGSPNLLARAAPQSHLPVVPQLYVTAPTSVNRSHLPGVPQLYSTAPTSVSRSQANFRESPAKAFVIYDPLPNDILLGRGKPIQQRPGNIRYREMIDKHMDKYEEGNSAKYAITAYIVHLLKEEGGRFLKEVEDGGWVEVDEATARLKISHAFRTRRKVLQATLKKGKNTA